MNDERERESTAEKVGEVTGGVGGTLAGGALGSIAGPVGTLIGAVAGGVGGWWAGEQAGRALHDWDVQAPLYRDHYETLGDRGVTWEDAQVGYSIGHVAGRNPDYASQAFASIEPDIREQWAHPVAYDRLRPYVETGFIRASNGVAAGPKS